MADETLEQELAYLRVQMAEYKLTLQVLAVMVERLLAVSPGSVVVIREAALWDTPDLVVDRHPGRGELHFKVER